MKYIRRMNLKFLLILKEGIENGLITRFRNMGSLEANPEIKLRHSIGSAWKTTHIETNQKQLNPVNGTLQVSFNPYQMNTFRLLPATK